jgi:hypothetical protein
LERTSTALVGAGMETVTEFKITDELKGEEGRRERDSHEMSP